MYVFLLVLGTAIAAAGVVLIGPGLPLGGQEYDASIITPGAISIVGGLILIGLGLAVRVLGRIEKALAARALPQPVVQPEAAIAVTVADTAAEEPVAAQASVPLPPLRPAEAAPQPAPAPAAPAAPRLLPEDAALERLREKFPTLVRLEKAPVVESAEVSLLPAAPARADEAEISAPVAQQANGAAVARQASRPERTRSFEAFWPKKPRPAQTAPTPPAPPAVAQPATQQSAAAALPVEPVLTPEPVQFQFREPVPEPRIVVPMPQAPAPVSVLKSGVVDGMAYTLYSDGSIEAQLPQGTLRFGSIAELRTHIEQSA
jgi:hypothetical protein